MKSFYITALALFACIVAITGCSKAFNDIDTEALDIEIIFNVKDIKGNNLLSPENRGKLGDAQIYAEYKGVKYSLDLRSGSSPLGFRLINNSKGLPHHLEFGPISGRDALVEQPLSIHIGSEVFEILITNKYEIRYGKSPLIKREILFNGKNHYSGMTIIDLVVTVFPKS